LPGIRPLFVAAGSAYAGEAMTGFSHRIDKAGVMHTFGEMRRNPGA